MSDERDENTGKQDRNQNIITSQDVTQNYDAYIMRKIRDHDIQACWCFYAPDSFSH